MEHFLMPYLFSEYLDLMGRPTDVVANRLLTLLRAGAWPRPAGAIASRRRRAARAWVVGAHENDLFDLSRE